MDKDEFREYSALMRAAMDTDDEFGEAIKAQFGPRATRCGHYDCAYNKKTLAAYNAKAAADSKIVAFISS